MYLFCIFVQALWHFFCSMQFDFRYTHRSTNNNFQVVFLFLHRKFIYLSYVLLGNFKSVSRSGAAVTFQVLQP